MFFFKFCSVYFMYNIIPYNILYFIPFFVLYTPLYATLYSIFYFVPYIAPYCALHNVLYCVPYGTLYTQSCWRSTRPLPRPDIQHPQALALQTLVTRECWGGPRKGRFISHQIYGRTDEAPVCGRQGSACVVDGGASMDFARCIVQ